MHSWKIKVEILDKDYELHHCPGWIEYTPDYREDETPEMFNKFLESAWKKFKRKNKKTHKNLNFLDWLCAEYNTIAKIEDPTITMVINTFKGRK